MTRRFFLIFALTFLVATIAIASLFVSHSIVSAEEGAYQTYVPMVGRASLPLSDFLGVFESNYFDGGYPNPPNEGNNELFFLRADGSEYQLLTQNEQHDSFAGWSYDNTYLLIERGEPLLPVIRESDLYVMKRDGTGERAIATLPGLERGVWSPTNNQILVYNIANVETYDDNSIYISTKLSTTLTPIVAHEKLTSPQWFTSGDAFWFAQNVDVLTDTTTIYVANSVGEIVVTQAVGPTRYAYEWKWSPDETKLAFLSPSEEVLDKYDLYVMSRVGGTPMRVATGIEPEINWYLDGSALVYLQQPVGSSDTELFSVFATGGTATQLTNNAHDDYFRAWIEEGERLAADGDGITLVKSDGTGESVFIERATFKGLSPDGKTIAFNLPYVDETGYYYNWLHIKTIGSDDLIQVSEPTTLDITELFWSADGKRLAYYFDFNASPGASRRYTYLAYLDRSPVVYEVIGNPGGWVSWIENTHYLLYFNGDAILNVKDTDTGVITHLPDFTNRAIYRDWQYKPQ